MNSLNNPFYRNGLKSDPVDPKRGILTYKHKDGEFSEIFDASTVANIDLITASNEMDIRLATRCLDLQYKIASEFFWIMEVEPYAVLSEVIHVLKPCFKNNLMALMSAVQETRRGLYSFARPSLRLTFESLMIAKFCSTNHETEIYDKWVDGKVVYFTNGVIKKIVKPGSEEFSRFWSVISNYTHSSIYAMQTDSCVENIGEDISLNFLLIHMLSECNFHILNSHIFTKSLKYYQSRYRNVQDIREYRDELKGCYSILRKDYNKPAKHFVRDYKSAWEVKNV